MDNKKAKPSISVLFLSAIVAIGFFQLIGQGMQIRDIAERLHLSVKTVEAHREHMKRKLDLDTASELLTYAVRWTQLEHGG